VPDLARERAHLVSPEGRLAVDRVLRTMAAAKRLRASQPAATLGIWLEQVWLELGGSQCVDAEGRVNLDLLWKSLDSLPQGEPDLLGSALVSALGDLKAQPDPAASGDCGVQLMTIHGAKGLEFEVVIVPDLQASPGRRAPSMLSWLERGLPPDFVSDDSKAPEIVTEFLVAPFAQKGADSGKAKKWVDRQRRERELHEACRLLYVAATRAREELHFFARPGYKSVNGTPSELVEPRESLLRTAWPAWQSKVQRRFDEWRATSLAQPATVDSIAASDSASGNLFEFQPIADEPTLLRRLPSGFSASTAPLAPPADEPLVGAGRLYERHEGGLLSRALGKAVHTLLQQLAQRLVTETRESALAALAQQPRIAATIRAAGIEPGAAIRMAAQAVDIVRQAAGDPLAQWILAPHADAANEIRWTGVVGGSLRTVQVDRVFRAGAVPQTAASPNEEAWWIIDYKTAHADSIDPTASLPELRRQFGPQIEAYAAVLRNLRGVDIHLCAGLYYPRMALFDWWQM